MSTAEKSAQEVLKRTLQSDSKTDMKNKQSKILLQERIVKMGRESNVFHTNYIKERTRCMQEMQRAKIELDFLRENGPSGGGPGKRMVGKKTAGEKLEDVFSTVLHEQEGEEEEEVDTLAEVGVPPHIRRLRFQQKEHEKKVRRRVADFSKSVEIEKRKFKELYDPTYKPTEITELDD